MVQQRLFYQQIIYDGERDSYYFHTVQSNHKGEEIISLYTGIKHNHTLWGETLDNLVDSHLK